MEHLILAKIAKITLIKMGYKWSLGEGFETF